MRKIAKQIHYNIDNLLYGENTKDGNYYLIYGEKSNGKSYQAKTKLEIGHYIKTHMKFILMRRWKDDLSSLWLEKYFEDIDVESLTEGKYNTINCWRGKIYLSNAIDEDGELKVNRGEVCGYYIALSTEQHYSSSSFLDVDVIVFEEFMERGMYIKNEVMKLEAFYSTVDRKRGTTKMFLIGNTITRINPYINEWKLFETFKRLKQGQITSIIMHKEGNDILDETNIKICIEYCRASGGKQMSISSNMIDKGNWSAEPQPHLPKSKKDYRVLFRCVFDFKNMRYLCELLTDEKNIFWFIFPKYTPIKPKTIVISDKISTSKYYLRSPYEIVTIDNKRIVNLLGMFRENNIFFSDDLTGTDFKNAIDFMIRK